MAALGRSHLPVRTATWKNSVAATRSGASSRKRFSPWTPWKQHDAYVWLQHGPAAMAQKWRLNRDYEYVQDSHHPLRRVSQWQSGNQSPFAISSTSRRYDVGGCSSSPGAPSVLSTQPLPTKEYLRLLRQLTIVPARLNFAVRKNQLVACIRITPLVQR